MPARSIDEILAVVEDHRAVLEATAPVAEQLGTAPAELVAAMRSIRVPLVKAPVEVGGDLLSMPDQLRFFSALAYLNPTAGWTGFNHAGAAGRAASSLPDAGVEEVFGGGAVPFFSAIATPTGTYCNADGGVVVDGTWRFASGIGHAEWLMLTAAPGPDAVVARLVVVPVAAVTVFGEWNVVALQGTGSLNITANGVFVPEHRVIDPRVGPLRGGLHYAAPYPVYVAAENLGFTLGVAQRFMDELRDAAASRSRGSLVDRETFRADFAEGQLQIDSVRSFALDALTTAWSEYQSGVRPNRLAEQRVAAMVAFGTERVADVAGRLFRYLGASGLLSGTVIERCYRDTLGSAQHLVASNVAYERLGALLIGV